MAGGLTPGKSGDSFGSVEMRLRSYYQSIPVEPPIGLETRVALSLDLAPRLPAATGTPWRQLAGLGLAAALVLVAALVVRGIYLGPAPAPSGAAGGPSASPTASPAVSPSAVPSATPSASPSETRSATPSPTPTIVPTVAPGTFAPTGALTIGRNYYTATLLQDGRVLIAGGLGTGENGSPAGPLRSAEIWSPATGKFTATGDMTAGRYQHTATLLGDGHVLMVGGADMAGGDRNLASAELYDPATGKFTATGSMTFGRARHTATLLRNGLVLIAGGAARNSLDQTELYDPSSGTFSLGGTMAIAREGATATLLRDGRVLIAGGEGPTGGTSAATATAELLDPFDYTFSAAGSMSAARTNATATLLADGRMLIAGGLDASGNVVDSADLFDPATPAFTATGPMAPAQTDHTATLLPNGAVLIVGGKATAATAELYVPATGGPGAFVPIGSAGVGGGLTATSLADGRVLLSGVGGATWLVYTPGQQ